MRRAQLLRTALPALAIAAGSAGCTHNYYYGSAIPVYSSPGEYGDVCEVPSQVSGGTVLVQSPSAPATVAAAPGTTRVLVSEPLGSGTFFRGGSRLAWRRPDPDSLITTRVEGGVDDATVTR
jgi:hypothetical protein